MRPRPTVARRAALAASLALGVALFAVPGVADAQEQQQQVFNPSPLAESAPTARRARAVAELALAGDVAKLEAYLREHAAAEVRVPTDAAALVGALRQGARAILRCDDLGPGAVGVVLASAAGGEPERAIVVRLEPEAPHRVRGVRLATLTVQGG